MILRYFYLLGDQMNRLAFSWWPSSGPGHGRIEFPISAGIGLVTRSVT